MYDELVGWLRSWSELPAHCECYESCEECNKQDICATFTNESIIAKAGEAADAIEELSKPRWIPVTERLPEKSGVYLGWMQWDLTDPDDRPSAYPIEYDDEEEAFGWWKSYYDSDSLGWAGEDFIRYEGVTHWMPLPEPPEED